MRIAFSGSHRTGKSSLLEALSERLPGYVTFDEPYHAMAEAGYEFNHPPAIEDFEAQLEHSVESLGGSERDALFDRCPLDFLAYLAVHEDAEDFDLDAWLARVRDAVETLDLVVFVPIEARDRIRVSPSDDEGETRTTVDEKLRELLLEDALELRLTVLEVEGSVEQRVRTVMAALAAAT
jgi:predicted ATPase